MINYYFILASRSFITFFVFQSGQRKKKKKKKKKMMSTRLADLDTIRKQHSFVKIHYEIFSTVIVILTLPLIQEGQFVSFWRRSVHFSG